MLKHERMERREWLYSVVREAMLHAGVLTASYKFKVLALDERGRQFLVMVDLAPQLGGDTGHLSKIEAQIVQTAKSRYDLVITSVYWRTNEHVAVGLAPRPGAAPVLAGEGLGPSAASRRESLTSAPAPLGQGGRFEPIQEDEVAAFKQALAASAQKPKAADEVRAAAVRAAAAGAPDSGDSSGYEDTEMQNPRSRSSALSATQYGELI
ncbi:hypothetical protein [Variovorax sp. HJSM1_2]|uniref:hypothetical protein n=1 Tax=Variovorax sp. HJSM1_2 TaxID=3366263 RepID=UPI003BBB5648